MKPWALLVGCLGVAPLMVVLGCPTALEVLQVPQDDFTPADELRLLSVEQRRSEELDAKLTEARRVVALKHEVAAQVIAQLLTLPEAAARFRALNEQLPGFDYTVFRMATPGRSDEERHCRAVIHWVKVLLASRPAEAAEVAARLEVELQEYLANDGAISFPPSASPLTLPSPPKTGGEGRVRGEADKDGQEVHRCDTRPVP